MRSEKKDLKAKEEFDRSIVASVAEIMARPRIAKSARVDSYEKSRARLGKPARHRARESAKAHIEQYASRTPACKNES